MLSPVGLQTVKKAQGLCTIHSHHCSAFHTSQSLIPDMCLGTFSPLTHRKYIRLQVRISLSYLSIATQHFSSVCHDLFLPLLIPSPLFLPFHSSLFFHIPVTSICCLFFSLSKSLIPKPRFFIEKFHIILEMYSHGHSRSEEMFSQCLQVC